MSRQNRHTIQRFFHWLTHVKTWQLAVLLVFAVVVSASLLRVNNLTMDRLRTAVAKADESGDTNAIKSSLVTLQNYVTSHMNTSLGSGVYLSESYARAREAAVVAASSSTNPNASVYQQASIECRSRFQGGVASFRNDYVTCVAERVKSLGVAEDPASSLKLPTAEAYHYNFVSPHWSLDLAGISVLVCVIITSVMVLRAVSALLLRLVLKHRFKTL